MSGVTGGHPILSIEQLLNELSHGQGQYCWLVSEAKPGIKKCSPGNGTMFSGSFGRLAFSWPGKCKHVVTPPMVADTRDNLEALLDFELPWLRSHTPVLIHSLPKMKLSGLKICLKGPECMESIMPSYKSTSTV
ncbi:hypothetical protein P7K49_014790 [Saguinus oedipus]|uniref:Uncharacterized protein n=1 Tax=Saguinus oedipus TaxID=9490 RepID=A0ABQ9V803_SAGOE|nr:hypothetical protein P7K49_014790 [Saguinus oedipus]